MKLDDTYRDGQRRERRSMVVRPGPEARTLQAGAPVVLRIHPTGVLQEALFARRNRGPSAP